MKVAAQGHNVAEVDAPSGARYVKDPKSGLFDMSESDARALVKGGGFYPSLTGATRRSVGFRCTVCGFGTYVTTCGRCGAPCEKEA